MASTPEVVEVEVLLAPIPGDNPAGESVQYSGIYDQIREARRSDENLAQGDWQVELKTADWDEALSLSIDTLKTKAKDLQISAWLTEALIRKHGFAGLREALTISQSLLERYWDQLYPEIDEGDMEARANAMSWLDRQAAAALKEVVITRAGGGNFNYLQYDEARKFDVPDKPPGVPLDPESEVKLSQLKELADQEKKVSGADFRKAKGSTRRAFYESTNTILEECWTGFKALDAVMDAKFERQTPGLGELKAALEQIRGVVDKIVKEKRILEPDPKPAAGPEGEGEAAEAGGATGAVAGGVRFSAAGAVAGRQDALRRLSEVADYFRRTEPHSPVSYLVQRAVAWGGMPLEAWLADVVKDGTVLEQLRETLGLNTGGGAGTPESSSSGDENG